MGRKPNPIILEYFHRGAKLEDASNRYQHTCKLCGETFPKGRIDSLTSHLTKKCASIPLSERTKIVLRLHDLGENDTSQQSKGSTRLGKDHTIDLPYSPSRRQNFNGLNVLAEASRRVGATDQIRNPYSDRSDMNGQHLLVDPALESDDFQTSFLNTSNDAHALRANEPSTASPPLATMFTYASSQNMEDGDESNPMPSLDMSNEHASSAPSHLSSLAMSANETLAKVMMPIEPGIELGNDDVSMTLLNTLGQLHTVNNGSREVRARSSYDWSNEPQDCAITEDGHLPPDVGPGSAQGFGALITTRQGTNLPRPIAINPNTRPTHFISESGTPGRPQKPKVRGRFSADRRKEVQQVRKQGACLRCRMLKKPCSGSTPCSTCQGVESARLWKHSCIRTRMADEFNLYSAGLHSTLAFHDINNVRTRVKFEPYLGHIEVQHVQESSPVIALKGLKGHFTPSSAGPVSGSTFAADQNVSTNEVYLLDTEADDVAGKVDRYLRDHTLCLCSQETSDFLRTTLLFAQRLGEGKDDVLLNKVLELWTATNMLSDVELKWKFVICPNEPLASQDDTLPQPPVTPSITSDRKAISDNTNPYSYALMCCQLRAAIERRTSNLGKSIMNEMERRLLQRQHSGRFETFLIAVIFLNCAERLCWLFLTWDHAESRKSQWPFDKHPGQYVEQGERFADVLNMLLKMRSLAPKTSPRPVDGVLMPIDDGEGHATQWYTNVSITRPFLDQVAAAQFDPSDSRSLDGKYFARVLQPQDCYT